MGKQTHKKSATVKVTAKMEKSRKNVKGQHDRDRRKKKLKGIDTNKDIDMMEDTVVVVKSVPKKGPLLLLQKEGKKKLDPRARGQAPQVALGEWDNEVVEKSLSVNGKNKMKSSRKGVSSLMRKAKQNQKKKKLVTKLKSFVLPKKSEDRFDSMLQQVKAFVEDEKNNHDIPEGHPLNEWLCSQRKLYDNGTLFAARLEGLSNLSVAGFYWLHNTFPRAPFFQACSKKANNINKSLDLNDPWVVKHKQLAEDNILPPWALQRLIALGVPIDTSNLNSTAHELDEMDSLMIKM